MSESDVVFMLIFSGVALALGLIAEANKDKTSASSTLVSKQEEAKIYYKLDRSRLREIADALPEHSIHNPVVKPLIEEANGYAETGDFIKARGRVNKAHRYLVQNAETFGFIRPLNKIFLAPEIPDDFDKDFVVESHTTSIAQLHCQSLQKILHVSG